MTKYYAWTLLTDSPWKRIPPKQRSALTRALWSITWALLVLGQIDAVYWEAAIAFSAVHATLVLGLVGFRPLVFPAQLRIAYVIWLVLGVHVPGLTVMMHITTLGLAALLSADYCPLARVLYLLPWNRTSSLSWYVLGQAFLQPPAPGRFQVLPKAAPASRPMLEAPPSAAKLI